MVARTLVWKSGLDRLAELVEKLPDPLLAFD
jgi:hypothetical protein